MNHAVKAGLIGGLLISGFILLTTFVAVPDWLRSMSNMITLLLILVTVFISIRRTRDLEKNGEITFKQGLKAGMTSGTLLSVLFGLTVFIISNYLTDVREVLNETHPVTKRKISETPTLLLNSSSIGILIQQIVFFTIMNMLFAFISSVMASVMLKRKKEDKKEEE